MTLLIVNGCKYIVFATYIKGYVQNTLHTITPSIYMDLRKAGTVIYMYTL